MFQYLIRLFCSLAAFDICQSIKCVLILFGASVFVFVYVSVSMVSCRVSGPLSMVTATLGCQHQGKGLFSLHLQWHGMPNTPNGSWEIVDMEHSCLFLPLSFLPLWNCFSHTFQPMLRVVAGLESVNMFTLMFMAIRGCL